MKKNNIFRWIVEGCLLLCMVSFGHAEEIITHAQPELPMAPLDIVGADGHTHHFTVELAKTPREQEIGEMFRTYIPADRGMLFVWPVPQESAMWMRNTLVPLDLIFIDAHGYIHAMEEQALPLSEAILSSHGSVKAVLELPGGTAEKMHVTVGDRIITQTLKEEVR